MRFFPLKLYHGAPPRARYYTKKAEVFLYIRLNILYNLKGYLNEYEVTGLKLNYKRVILVGFAFFLIITFWTAYDTVVPKILTDRFGMSQAWSGVIMALDNILALFMLPLFGGISDRCKHRWGRRKPFVFYGTVAAMAALLLLSAADYGQLKYISDAAVIDDGEALAAVYDSVADRELTTPEGKKFVLSNAFADKESFVSVRSEITEARFKSHVVVVTFDGEDSKEQTITDQSFKLIIVTPDGKNFYLRDRDTGKIDDKKIVSLKVQESGDAYLKEIDLESEYADGAEGFLKFKKVTNTVYTNFVAPARQEFIRLKTDEKSTYLIFFIVTLLVLLIAMATFRSPAVALMPDVVVKPLRSKANAVINLMGTLGGIVVLVLGMGFAFNNGAIKNTFRPYFLFFAVIAAIMGLALAVFMAFVKEKKWSEEADSAEYLIDGEPPAAEEPAGGGKLSRPELFSLIFILSSVVLWFMGYNAVTSKYSVYATNMLDLDYSTTLLIANAAAVISYIPVGIISSKIGRKKAILSGIVMLTASFTIASFMRVGSSAIVMNIMFALAGIGWATINVNSFPMVVELSKHGSVGKYTGYYYAASMAAQVVTPVLSGMLMDKVGMFTLFPYAAIFASLSFVTMLFVRHGDSKPEPPKSALEAFDNDD